MNNRPFCKFDIYLRIVHCTGCFKVRRTSIWNNKSCFNNYQGFLQRPRVLGITMSVHGKCVGQTTAEIFLYIQRVSVSLWKYSGWNKCFVCVSPGSIGAMAESELRRSIYCMGSRQSFARVCRVCAQVFVADRLHCCLWLRLWRL